MRPGTAAELADQYATSILEQVAIYSGWKPGLMKAFFEWHVTSALTGGAPPGSDLHDIIEEVMPEMVGASPGAGDVPSFTRVTQPRGPATVGPQADEHGKISLHAAVVKGIENLNPSTAANVVFTGQDYGNLALWRKHKVIYAIDDDLWNSLGETDDDTKIPAGLFTHLPHPDPFIAFPDPIVLPLADGNIQRVGGFFLSGRRHGAVQQSTHAPGTDSYGLLLVGGVFTPAGQQVRLKDGSLDHVFTRATVADGVRLGDMLHDIHDRFYAVFEAASWDEAMPVMVRRALALLIYLCATNADLTPVPQPPVKRVGKRGGRTVRDTTGPKIVTVGYRVGAELRRYRQQHEPGGGRSGFPRHLAPHIRRAHFHTYRVGPGREETLVRWLAPIPINVHGLADRPVVHPVHKVKVAPRSGEGS